MPTFYKSVTTSWSSNPQTGKKHGQRNIVEIKNEKGVKIKEALNARGAVFERKRQTLKAGEVRNIMRGNFVPGLWKSCGLQCDKRRRRHTRKVKRA